VPGFLHAPPPPPHHFGPIGMSAFEADESSSTFRARPFTRIFETFLPRSFFLFDARVSVRSISRSVDSDALLFSFPYTKSTPLPRALEWILSVRGFLFRLAPRPSFRKGQRLSMGVFFLEDRHGPVKGFLSHLFLLLSRVQVES